jgi:hypothetical protein
MGYNPTWFFSCAVISERFRSPDYWLKGKTVMMVSSNIKSKSRAQQILDAAIAAGAQGTFLCENVGKHDFPVAAYKKLWFDRRILPPGRRARR